MNEHLTKNTIYNRFNLVIMKFRILAIFSIYNQIPIIIRRKLRIKTLITIDPNMIRYFID